MRNPYKKFQNSSIQGSKVMLCIKKCDERMDGRTEGQMNNPEAICPSNFFEVGGIKKRIWHFMQIVSIRDNLHEMSNPVSGIK